MIHWWVSQKHVSWCIETARFHNSCVCVLSQFLCLEQYQLSSDWWRAVRAGTSCILTRLPLGQLGAVGSLSCKEPVGHYQLAVRPKGAFHQPPAGSICLPYPPEGLLYKWQHIPWFQAPRFPNHMFHHKGLWNYSGTFTSLFLHFWATIHPDFNTMFELEIAILHLKTLQLQLVSMERR